MLRLFALICLPLLIVAEEPRCGIITDAQDVAIPYVFIHNLNQDSWEISNDRGEFTLSSSFATGDTLEFSRIGFKPVQIQLQDVIHTLHITLQPYPVSLKAVSITAQQSTRSSLREMGQISKIATSGNVEHRQLLAGIPGLTLRTYGGPAGISTLSLDGGPASHTKVIVSGFDLTSAQNGEMDISQLPTPFVEKVTYFPQEGTYYGPGSSDGVIYLDPWTDRIGFSLNSGSYGHRSMHGTFTLNHHWLVGSMLVGMRHDDGNYPVSWRDRSFKRRNNEFDQQYGALQLRAVTSKQTFLRFLYLHSFQERGVAGQVWSPDPQAHRDDRFQVTGLTFGWVNKRGHGSLQVMYRGSNELYTDTNPKIDSRHRLSTWQVELKQNHRVNKRIEVASQLDARQEAILSSDTESHLRTIFSGTITSPLKLTPIFEIHPVLRHDNSPNLFSESSYELGLIFPVKSKFFSTAAFYRRYTFRYPTFNDLYWKPGGNPDLQPEHSKNTSILVAFPLPLPGDLRVLLFQKSSDDLIQWTPSLNYWQPKNIKRAERKGWKMTWRWFVESIHLSGFINYSSTQTEDLSPGVHRGKPLRYAPGETAAIGIDWRPTPCLFHLQVHHTSDRISMYSWPKDVILPAITVVTAYFAFTWKQSFGDVVFVGTIDNLTDELYETVYGYPEPGRTFRFTISYEK